MDQFKRQTDLPVLSHKLIEPQFCSAKPQSHVEPQIYVELFPLSFFRIVILFRFAVGCASCPP